MEIVVLVETDDGDDARESFLHDLSLALEVNDVALPLGRYTVTIEREDAKPRLPADGDVVFL